MQVVRVEYYTGLGLWRAHNGRYKVIDDHSKYSEIVERHSGPDYPTFWGDYELMNGFEKRNEPSERSKYFFAFLSLEQLKNALTTEEIKECLDLGFKVLLLELSDHIASKYQVIFKKEWVTSSQDISSLFK